MIHYTKLSTSEREFLVFKVIGARSQTEAEDIVKQHLGDSLLDGEIWEDNSVTICPLFSNETSAVRLQ
ncbi:MAG TPA: hypothetical protein DHV36_13055 [Desulfobacteraceae bacterium]|nr:hypothetical protein [Desulfobacteraceae bacterium]